MDYEMREDFGYYGDERVLGFGESNRDDWGRGMAQCENCGRTIGNGEYLVGDGLCKQCAD